MSKSDSAALPQEYEGSRKADKPAMSVHRFLQMKPQSKGIRALLLSKYREEAKTLENWESAVRQLLAKKIQ
jgi:hypothetical protein